MRPSRWPFAARLIAVSTTLALLLAVAVTLLVLARPIPNRATGAATQTISRPLPPPATAPSAAAARSPNSIVPAGLPTGSPPVAGPHDAQNGTATITVPRARSSAG